HRPRRADGQTPPTARSRTARAAPRARARSRRSPRGDAAPTRSRCRRIQLRRSRRLHWEAARSPLACSPLTAGLSPRQTPNMPRLVRLDTGDDIGNITDAHKSFLVTQLEDEKKDDTDYYINRETIELLSDNGADPELLALLEKGLAGDDEMD